MAIKKKNKRRTTPVRRTSSPVRVTPAFVTPMAAQVVKRLPEGDDWTYELKFDGYRALIIKEEQRVELRSRKNKDPTGMYRGIAAAGLRRQRPPATAIRHFFGPCRFGSGDYD
jgi:ATP-dependent DNA ligase